MLALSHFVLASSLISSSLAATFNVDVGNGGLTFNPPQVNAQAGDEVIFNFYPKNHTVTQSTLASPCTAVGGGGTSGFMPVAAGAAVRPTKRIVVPDATTPLWFFCEQGNHCQQGMVFAINPKSQEQMDTFIANAKGIAAPPPASSPPAAPPTDTTTPPADQTTTVAPPTGTDAPGAPAAPGAGREILIDVGAGGLKFTPEQVTAVVGDTLVFTFKGGAHTVTQSSFAQPCTKLATGVDSGPKPAAGLTSGFPNFTIPITDVSKPLWFFCATGNHCPSGMVFSVNAPATGNTHDKFKATAMGAPGAGASVSGSGSITAPGPEQTAPGNSASSLVGRASGLLVAAAIAALLL